MCPADGGADLAQTYDSTLDAETVLNIASDVQVIGSPWKHFFDCDVYTYGLPSASAAAPEVFCRTRPS